MRDLRISGMSADAAYLVLTAEGPEPAEYRLPIDDRLRAALRGELGPPEVRLPSSLSPRDIQARLRAGDPLEVVARAAGVTPEWVARFAGPVLAERTLVASEARRSPLSTSAGAEDITTPLGELVAAYAESAGHQPATLGWDAWRRDDGRWVVQVSLPAGARPASARFLWDPRVARLTGLDEAATVVVRPHARQPPELRPAPEPVPEPRPEASVDPPRRAQPARRSRPSVPAWADVLLGAPDRSP
jgi:hypothetical protein